MRKIKYLAEAVTSSLEILQVRKGSTAECQNIGMRMYTRNPSQLLGSSYVREGSSDIKESFELVNIAALIATSKVQYREIARRRVRISFSKTHS
jgi:hypothetical protein